MKNYEEFTSLEDIPDHNENTVDIFQIHPGNKSYEIVKVGQMESSGNELIKQLTYKQQIVRIVNCLYDKTEIDHYIEKNIIPLVEIYVFGEDLNYIVFSYCLRPIEKVYIITRSSNKNVQIIDVYDLPINKDKVIEELIIIMKKELNNNIKSEISNEDIKEVNEQYSFEE